MQKKGVGYTGIPCVGGGWVLPKQGFCANWRINVSKQNMSRALVEEAQNIQVTV